MASELQWLPDLKPDLMAAYQATGRWYHNWDHIEALMEDFHRLADHWLYPEAVETAILWHDVIYTAMSPTNEADSAALMRDRLKGCGDPATIDRADALILATADHAFPDDMPSDLAADCALFLDMDMAILGADPDRFDRYDAAIRQEFSAVPDDLYRPRRAEVLKGFLRRNDLYLTDVFKQSHDQQARDNLRRAISRLS